MMQENVNLNKALIYANWQGILFNIERNEPANREEVTEDQFNLIVWGASKYQPSWEEVIEWEKLHDLFRRADYYNFYNNPARIKARYLEAAEAHIASGLVHSGSGLGHMAGLLQMVEQATIAGSLLPQIHLQNKEGGTHRIQTQSLVREVLNRVAENENKIESCHNLIMGIHKHKTATWQNKDLPIEAREQAADEAKSILENYEELLKTEIEKYDPAALPTDLKTLKEVLIEHIEAHALEKVKDLKGVKTQQGADLPASCLDSENAIRKVAELVYKASSIIDLAKTNQAAISNRDLYKDKIDKVSPLNTPLLIHVRSGQDDVVVDKTGAEPYTLEAESAIFKIENPHKVASHVQYSVIHEELSTIEEIGRLSSSVSFRLSRGSLAKVEFGIKARNICGPHRYKVVLQAPEGEN